MFFFIFVFFSEVGCWLVFECLGQPRWMARQGNLFIGLWTNKEAGREEKKFSSVHQRYKGVEHDMTNSIYLCLLFFGGLFSCASWHQGPWSSGLVIWDTTIVPVHALEVDKWLQISSGNRVISSLPYLLTNSESMERRLVKMDILWTPHGTRSWTTFLCCFT